MRIVALDDVIVVGVDHSPTLLVVMGGADPASAPTHTALEAEGEPVQSDQITATAGLHVFH